MDDPSADAGVDTRSAAVSGQGFVAVPTRVLEFMKNNYGPVQESLTLRWNRGLFLPVNGTGSLDKLAAEQQVEDLFLKLLARFASQGRHLSDRSAANNYAPAEFGKEPEAKSAGFKKAALESAMRRLFAANRIHVEPYGPPSRGWTKLATGSV
jgi:hypothetical protein